MALAHLPIVHPLGAVFKVFTPGFPPIPSSPSVLTTGLLPQGLHPGFPKHTFCRAYPPVHAAAAANAGALPSKLDSMVFGPPGLAT
jgi:hypothetical protein